MKHIAPNAGRPSTRMAARVGLLLTASFLLAGLFIVSLIGLGFQPLG